jgi:hypothetical protein
MVSRVLLPAVVLSPPLARNGVEPPHASNGREPAVPRLRPSRGARCEYLERGKPTGVIVDLVVLSCLVLCSCVAVAVASSCSLALRVLYVLFCARASFSACPCRCAHRIEPLAVHVE